MHGYVQTYLGLSNIVEICKQCTATAVQNTYILKSQLLESQDLLAPNFPYFLCLGFVRDSSVLAQKH